MTGQVRVTRGCWIDADDAPDLRRQCAAVLAVAAPHTVVVDVTAARLHRLWLPERAGGLHLATSTPGRAPSHMTRPRRGELQTHRRSIPPTDLAIVDGVPVMSLARTWRDLATSLSVADLVAAGDSVLRTGATLDELSDVLRRRRGCSGAKRAATALPMLNSRSRSRPESHLRVALLQARLPQFAVNCAVTNDLGEWLAEPDLSCVPAKIALEYQGVEHAETTRMRKDITRSGDPPANCPLAGAARR